MSLTTSGALKTVIERFGLKLTADRDAPPAGTKTPYCTIAEGLSLTSDGLEDGADFTATELAQLDLWQSWRDSSGKLVEDRALADNLHRKLNGLTASGQPMPSAPVQVYGIKVRNKIRLLERNNNLVHHAYTLSIRRVI